MRIMFVHPNYHSGGAEIAGTWPPAWVAYLTGYLKAGGYNDIVFVDAMTLDLSEDAMRKKFAEVKPDIVGCTAITPSIYKAQRLLQVAKEVDPKIVTVLGGIHATFMFSQVLGESPWIDAVVRGEGEAVFLNLVKAVDAGNFMQNRESVPGIAFRNEEGKIVSTAAEPPIADLDTITPDWGILDWSKYIYTPLNVRVAIPTSPVAARSPAAFAASGSSGAAIASVTRRRWWTRSKRWCVTTKSAFSFWLMKSPPSTARNSSSSANCLLSASCRCIGALTPV